MELPDIAHEYKFIFNRLNKLNKSIIGIVKQNTQLKESNAKLRISSDTMLQQLAAQERVLNGLQKRYDELQAVGNPPEVERTQESPQA